MCATETALWSVLVAYHMLTTHLGLVGTGYRIDCDRERFAGYVAAVLVSRKIWEPWEESTVRWFGRPRLAAEWAKQLPTGYSTTPGMCDPEQRKAYAHLQRYMRSWLDDRKLNGRPLQCINTAAVWDQTCLHLCTESKLLVSHRFWMCARANAGQLVEHGCYELPAGSQRRRVQ